MSITRHHNEWLSLVPNSGPFLSLPVLAQAFPQGLDAHDAEHSRRLRLAFDEWDDNQLGQRPDAVINRAWVKFVLGETLSYDELLAQGQEIPQSLKSICRRLCGWIYVTSFSSRRRSFWRRSLSFGFAPPMPAAKALPRTSAVSWRLEKFSTPPA
jgi:hypothetical protein